MDKEQKDAIRELAELLHANNLSEIDYESEGVHIRVVGPRHEHRAGELAVVSSHPMPVVPDVHPVPVAPENKPVVKAENNIVSPMVGVVYLSKDPSSPAFVKVGDKVSVGQTVCLIEAMKTFNPIKSTKAGTITAVLVENGSPVEYNQPLFSVE